MSAQFTSINSRFYPASEASLQVSDLSIQRGYGIFDFFKTMSGKAIFLDDHLDRLYTSAATMQLHIDLDRDELKQHLKEFLAKNNLPDSGVRITLTGGYSADGYTLDKPNMIITQQAYDWDKELGQGQRHLITYDYQRQLHQAKTLDYITAIWLQPQIKQAGADDVLYVPKGSVRECPRANFFLIDRDGRACTQAEGILKGVIRKQLLHLNGNGTPIIEKDLTLEDLDQAAEAFICSTTKNVLPVTRINGKELGNGKPGPVTLAISKKLEQWLKETNF